MRLHQEAHHLVHVFFLSFTDRHTYDLRRCTLQSSSYQTPPKDNRNPLGDNLTFLRRQESRGGDCRAPVVSCVEVRSHVCTVPKSPRNLSHLSRVRDSFGFFEVMAHNSTRRNKPAKRDAWGLLRRGRSDILFDRKHQQERFDGTAPKGQHKTNKASTLGACPSTQPGRSKSVRHRYIRKMEEHLLKGGRDIPDRRRRRRRLLLGSNESSPNKVYERTLPMSDGPLAPADAIASSTHFCVVASSASCNEKQSETKNGDEMLIAKTAHRYGGTHAEKKNKTIDLSRGRGSTVRTRWLHQQGSRRARTHTKKVHRFTLAPLYIHTSARQPSQFKLTLGSMASMSCCVLVSFSTRSSRFPFRYMSIDSCCCFDIFRRIVMHFSSARVSPAPACERATANDTAVGVDQTRVEHSGVERNPCDLLVCMFVHHTSNE